jgi:hypothetical protein
MGWNVLHAKEKDDGRDVAYDTRRQGAPLYAMLAGAIDGDEKPQGSYGAPHEGRQALPVTAGLRRPVWHRSLGFDGKSDFAIALAYHRDGLRRARILGSASAHGAWLAWRKA